MESRYGSGWNPDMDPDGIQIWIWISGVVNRVVYASVLCPGLGQRRFDRM